MMSPRPRDGRLQLVNNLLAGLAGVDAPIHLDLAAVRHDVWARAAVDRANREIWRAEQAMAPSRQSVAESLQLEHEPRRSSHSVVPQLG